MKVVVKRLLRGFEEINKWVMVDLRHARLLCDHSGGNHAEVIIFSIEGVLPIFKAVGFLLFNMVRNIDLNLLGLFLFGVGLQGGDLV
jgi:hypothetical protein